MHGVLLPWVQSFALFLLEPDEVSFGPVLRSVVVCLLVEALPFAVPAPSSSLPPSTLLSPASLLRVQSVSSSWLLLSVFGALRWPPGSSLASLQLDVQPLLAAQ